VRSQKVPTTTTKTEETMLGMSIESVASECPKSRSKERSYSTTSTQRSSFSSLDHSSNNGKQGRGIAVHFDESPPVVHETISRWDMTNKEMNHTFYSPVEFQSFIQEAVRLVDEMEDTPKIKYSLDSDADDFRGLESMTKQGKWNRFQHYRNTVTEVLKKQRDQQRRKKDDDAEQLAITSFVNTTDSWEEAVHRGKKYAKAASKSKNLFASVRRKLTRAKKA